MTPSFLHKILAHSSRTTRAYWEILRKFYIFFFNDPQSKVTINGMSLLLPLSHQLPIYLSDNSEYDKLIGRIANWLRKDFKSLTFVDVGANIGDTIAQFSPCSSDQIIAIEPNEKFSFYLEMNYGTQANIKIVKLACASQLDYLNLTFDERNGTATLVKSKASGNKLTTTTLDLISNQLLENTIVQFIKIDTDGFDFEVLKGAKSTLSKYTPVLLFECDIFRNQNYIEDINQALNDLYSCGYTEFLVYDNYGYLLGKYPISDRKWFFQLINYQCSGGVYYFDLLFINDVQLNNFYDSELIHLKSISKSESAKNAAEQIRKIRNARLI